jgi:hypothetical protein
LVTLESAFEGALPAAQNTLKLLKSNNLLNVKSLPILPQESCLPRGLREAQTCPVEGDGKGEGTPKKDLNTVLPMGWNH